MRFVTQRDGLHFLGRRHLEIQWRRQTCHQSFDIFVANVTPVFAQMRGDAISTRRLGQKRRAHRIRIGRTACVSNRCHVINIHTKTHDALLNSCR